MSDGPLSPDGKHQLVAGEWVPVPKPPRSGVDRAHNAFQIALVVLVVVVVLAALVALLGA